MKVWKLALVVWAPVIIIAVIYGIFYITHYEHAKHIFNKYQSAMNNCNQENQNATAPAGEIPQIFNCPSSPGSMSHGFLWLPRYQQ